jgi:hypothetical protein
MPNGWDKNWVRLCAAVDGFRARYGTWPTRVRMSPAMLENLRKHIFDPISFAQLESKLKLVGDEAPMIAEDEEGRSYSYGAEGFTKVEPDIRARDWLGVKPRLEAWW